MKRILILFSILLCATSAYSQTDSENDDYAGKIAITPYVEPELGFNKEVSKQLINKMSSILTKQGLAGSKNQRFIITCSANVLSEDIVVTTKEMYQYELEINFFIGDGVDGVTFSSVTQESKGLGESKAAAYLEAIKKVKTGDPKYQTFVNEAKVRIVKYYDSIAPDLINRANSLKAAEKYDEALYILSNVPSVCSKYSEVEKVISEIYFAKVDHEAKPILVEAKALWAAEPSPVNAEKVMTILAKIDPDAPCYAEAENLMKTVNDVYVKELQRKRALEERAYQDAKARELRAEEKEERRYQDAQAKELRAEEKEERRYQDAQAKEQRDFDENKSRYMMEFEMRKAQQAHDFEMDPLRIKAAQKIGVAQAKNQPKLDYSQVKGILSASVGK